MGQKDLAQNDYFSDLHRFADACNGILFQGEAVVSAEELQEVNSEIVYQEQGTYRKVIPDKICKWMGTYIAILTLENQTKVDYSMVFRVMKSEAISYEKQWTERAKEKAEEGKLSFYDELCWKGKDEYFIPVITIVIYFGKDKKWDGARCLYEMLDIGENIKPFVTNYRINLFDYHEHEDFKVFQTENRELFEMLSCAKNKKKMNELLNSNIRYRKMDSKVAKNIATIIGQELKLEKETEVIDMCQAWDDWREEGRCEGIEIGRCDTKLEDIRNIMENFNVTVSQAMNCLKIPEVEKEKYLSLLK